VKICVVAWQKIFQQAALKDMDKIQRVYSEAIIKIESMVTLVDTLIMVSFE